MRMRSKLAGLSVALLVAPIIFVAAQPAAAQEIFLDEVTSYGETIFWNTGRINYKRSSTATFRLDFQRPGTGAPFSIGMRNSGGQFARTEVYAGRTGSFKTSTGRLQMPYGTFYLNTRVNGACGGIGCGPQHWRGLFRWDL